MCCISCPAIAAAIEIWDTPVCTVALKACTGRNALTCAKEGYYAYQMSLKGKTVQEIRAGIMAKDFESIDLNSIGM